MASQIHAGLDGVARKLDPGPSADSPYEISVEPLPKTLQEALARCAATHASGRVLLRSWITMHLGS
jgi:glutamine synthetase